MHKIPYLALDRIHKPIKQELIQCALDVMDNEWYIMGSKCKEFEEQFASYCGTKYCVGTGNGLDSLRIILQALNIGVGDEVIVPANTFIASVLAIVYVGATPVLVDADLQTLNIDLNKIEKAITEHTKAIMPVHLYGRIVEMDKIMQIAQKYKLYVIEDAAQAHGSVLLGRKAGSFGIASAFSFYPGKNLGALGDAGGIVTNDFELYKKMKAISNYGSSEKYNHKYKGCNSRMDELQASFLSVKLKHLDSWNHSRRQLASYYLDHIKNDEFILPMKEQIVDGNHVFHIFPVLCKNRKHFIDYMKEKNIECLIHYPIPLPEQVAFIDYEWEIENYPVTKLICDSEVSIPLYPELTIEERDYIVQCLNDFRVL